MNKDVEWIEEGEVIEKFIERARSHLPVGHILKSVKASVPVEGKRQKLKVDYEYNGKHFFTIVSAGDVGPLKRIYK